MDNLALTPVNQCLSKAGLAAGTTTTYTTGAAALTSIKGKLYSKAAVTNGATPTIDPNTGVAYKPVPVNFGSVFVFAFDAGGTVRVYQGGIEALDVAGNFVLAPQFPIVPDTACAVGYVVVKVGSTGAAWTFGASNLAGPPSGVVLSFQDINTLPDRPQVA